MDEDSAQGLCIFEVRAKVIEGFFHGHIDRDVTYLGCHSSPGRILRIFKQSPRELSFFRFTKKTDQFFPFPGILNVLQDVDAIVIR